MPIVGQFGAEALLSNVGALLPNTAVTVLNVPSGSNAVLYTDATGGTTGPNPVNTDANGNLIFYAAFNQYDLKVAGVVVGRVIVDVTGAAVGAIGGPAGPLTGAGLVPAAQIPVGTTVVNFLNVKASPYNAVGDGVADDTTAIASALTDAHTAGGTVYLPPGTYKTTAALNVTKPTVSIAGANSASVTIRPTNNGDCIRWKMSPFVADMNCGSITGLTIDGVNAAASSAAIHYSDAMNGKLDDLHIVNFTGVSAKGIWMDNVSYYTEGIEWGRLLISANTTGILFDINSGGSTGGISNSFGYHRMKKVRLTCNAGQVGVRLQNGALIYNSEINLSGNFANGSTFLQIAGITNVGTTAMANCLYCIQCETTSGVATGITLTEYGSMTGAGVIDLSSGTFTSAVAGTHPGTMDLSGWIRPGSGLVGTIRPTGQVHTSAPTAGTITLPAAALTYDVWINGTRYVTAAYTP